MKYRQLGGTGLEVSVLGFGAATLGNEYGPIQAAEGRRAVHCALDKGITFFDVAPYYGRTLAERRLGEFLDGRRNDVVISTKVGRYDRHPPKGFDFSAERVARSVEESLTRLRTDWIDVYIAHDIEFADLSVIVGETLPAMARLKEQGKVRAIGISGFPLEALRKVASEADVDVILSYCHYTLLNTRLATSLAPFARERGIGLVNGSPLHMGVLTDGGPPPWHPAPREMLSTARKAVEWCEAHAVDIAEIALCFALQAEEVASTLVGMRSVAEVDRNVAVLNGETDEDALAMVRRILAPVQDVEWMVGRPENNPAHAETARQAS